MSDQNDDSMIGKVIGNGYAIERLIGKGGMSYVYQAHDTTKDTDVAVKIVTLQRDRAKELEKRFDRESRIMQELYGHRNIISIFDSGEINHDTFYLTMELIRGDTLTQRIKRYRHAGEHMPFEEIVSIMGQIGDALDYMHEKKIIHRDMKPSNIMIEKGTERAVLMDFGLVMIDTQDNSTMGTAFGTPRYIAPEQAISSQQAVPQSDLYSLGVIIYECLTNHTPFDEESAMSMALSHITNEPPDPRDFRADLPEAVAKVVLKSLEKPTDKRYQTAREFIEALKHSMGIESSWHSLPLDPDESTHRPDPTQGLPDGWQTNASQESLMTGEHEQLSPTPLSASRNKTPLLVGVGVVALILVIAFVAVLSGGSGVGGTDDGAALQLFYSNNSLTIYNVSGGRVDLNDYQLTTPDNNHTLNMATFRNPILADSACVIVALTDTVTAPEACESTTSEVEVHARKIIENYYWVWDSGQNSSGEFNVVYRGRTIKTCQIADGECRTRG